MTKPEQTSPILTQKEIEIALERMTEKYPAIRQFYDVLKQEPDGGESLIRETVAQAQAKKIAEWGNEPCPHKRVFLYYEGNPILKRECPKCWQLLLEKEAGK